MRKNRRKNKIKQVILNITKTIIQVLIGLIALYVAICIIHYFIELLKTYQVLLGLFIAFTIYLVNKELKGAE